MKVRILKDSSIMWLLVLCSPLIFLWDAAYILPIRMDDIVDVFAIMLAMSGIFFRMAGRAHKKHKSRVGSKLVTSGIYALCRNPMYLGTFTVGLGLVLLVMPLWVAPIFVAAFMFRFHLHILGEEKKLMEMFGKEYRRYCAKTPRVLPKLSRLNAVPLYDTISLDESMSTPESRAFVYIPIGACLIELLQEHLVYQRFDIFKTITFIALGLFWFGSMIVFLYQRPKKRRSR